MARSIPDEDAGTQGAIFVFRRLVEEEEEEVVEEDVRADGVLWAVKASEGLVRACIVGACWWRAMCRSVAVVLFFAWLFACRVLTPGWPVHCRRRRLWRRLPSAALLHLAPAR